MNYSLWLHSLDGIGEKKRHALLNCFLSSEGIYSATEKELRKIRVINQNDIETILYRRNREKIDEFEENLIKQGIRFFSMEDDGYPQKLRNITDAPYGIFVRGELPKEDEKVVAIVGARMCTPYGKKLCTDLASKLARCNVSVISGLARGIDGHAQQACIDSGGRCYGVLAGGVDIIYPPEHRNLYYQIIEQGGMISEYLPETQPLKGMFPRRNRIISGLADMVILVEAKLKSGSLITADFALEQGRDIYAFPGRIDDVLSAGCNNYIKQGAGIIDDIDSFLEEQGFLCNKNISFENTEKIHLEKEESIVYSCLRLTPCSINELVKETGLDLMKVISCLGRLEELGLAEEYYKNYYIRSN